MDGGHLSGVSSCGSVHSCPFCAAIIRQTRAVELQHAIERWLVEGGRVYFITLTAQHVESHSLASSLDALGLAWRSLMSGRNRRRMDASLGRSFTELEPPKIGMVRAIDITHGRNGWHPHYHCVAFVGSWVESTDIQRFVIAPWLHGTGLAGRQAVTEACHTVELRSGDGEAFGLAAYALKADRASMDVLRIDTKTAGAGASPFALLGLALGGNAAAAELWREYSVTMHGRRSAVWTRRLKQWAKVDDANDEDLVTGALEDPCVVGYISNPDHRRLKRMRAGEPALLACIEKGTWLELLQSLDIEVELP